MEGMKRGEPCGRRGRSVVEGEGTESKSKERGALYHPIKRGCECCVWSWTHPWVNALEPLHADGSSSLSLPLFVLLLLFSLFPSFTHTHTPLRFVLARPLSLSLFHHAASVLLSFSRRISVLPSRACSRLLSLCSWKSRLHKASTPSWT